MPRAKPVTFDTVRQIARTLPDVEESSHFGAFSVKHHGALFACVAIHKSAEPGSLMVRMDFDQRDALLAEAPEIFYIAEHYKNYPCVLVRLSQVREDQLRDLLASGHRFVGGKKKRRAAGKRPNR